MPEKPPLFVDLDGTLVRTDTTAASILALIEARWRLAPLTGRDAAADPLSGAFDFDEHHGEDR